jgi:hypothetical protein
MASTYGAGAYGYRLYSAGVTNDFRGDLTPSISFSALGMDVVTPPGNVAGDIQPLIALGGSLTGDWVLREGSIAPSVVLAATLTSGPLWGPSQLCEAEWVEAELCDG